jgi:hypothetical protein
MQRRPDHCYVPASGEHLFEEALWMIELVRLVAFLPPLGVVQSSPVILP